MLKTPLAARAAWRCSPLTGIPPEAVPGGAEQAVAADRRRRATIAGVVWRDFKPGGGTPGKVEQGELGLPGVKLELRDASGKKVALDEPAADGTFAFDGVEAGSYKVGDRAGDVPAAVRRGRVARPEADHAVADDRLHLGVGGLRDGRDRGRPRGDPARHARGGAHRRRAASGRCSGA